MKKDIIVFSVLWIALAGCDNREDFARELNNAPVMKISSKSNAWVSDTAYYSGTIYDTLKLGINDRYRFDVRISDDGITQNLKLNVPSFQFMDNTYYIIDNQKVDNSSLSDVVIEGVDKNTEIEYFTDLLSNHSLLIKVDDIYGGTDAVTIQLFVFDNWNPVADISYQVVSQVSPYEVKLDASGSYDLDERFGGMIVEYEYNIDDVYMVNTDVNFINFIFSGTGIYQVKLRVKDNDGVWTNEETIIVSL